MAAAGKKAGELKQLHAKLASVGDCPKLSLQLTNKFSPVCKSCMAELTGTVTLSPDYRAVATLELEPGGGCRGGAQEFQGVYTRAEEPSPGWLVVWLELIETAARTLNYSKTVVDADGLPNAEVDGVALFRRPAGSVGRVLLVDQANKKYYAFADVESAYAGVASALDALVQQRAGVDTPAHYTTVLFTD